MPKFRAGWMVEVTAVLVPSYQHLVGRRFVLEGSARQLYYEKICEQWAWAAPSDWFPEFKGEVQWAPECHLRRVLDDGAEPSAWGECAWKPVREKV